MGNQQRAGRRGLAALLGAVYFGVPIAVAVWQRSLLWGFVALGCVGFVAFAMAAAVGVVAQRNPQTDTTARALSRDPNRERLVHRLTLSPQFFYLLLAAAALNLIGAVILATSSDFKLPRWVAFVPSAVLVLVAFYTRGYAKWLSHRVERHRAASQGSG